jgi:protease-4
VSGANKDLANPLEPMREGQYAILQRMVDDMYARFAALVRERRPGIANMEEAADGRVVTGERALQMGLVDRLGGVREAFDRAKTLGGISRARVRAST